MNIDQKIENKQFECFPLLSISSRCQTIRFFIGHFQPTLQGKPALWLATEDDTECSFAYSYTVKGKVGVNRQRVAS